MARVICPVGNFENPGVEARRRGIPSAPGWILALRLCCTSGGSQPISSSRPTDDEQVGAAAAVRMKLGFGFDEVRILVARRDGL